jgi:AmmeMemoRadiSam system protein B
MIRNPIVAGGFYPGTQKVLEEQVKEFLEKVEMEKKFDDILGIISPHAGYVYSGQCAAYGFKALQQKDFETAVIIAPSHRFGNFRYSVGNFAEYVTPLGKIKVNKKLTKQLLEYDEFDFIQLAHNSEHSLEVQLPFLQIINQKAQIVPILLGNQNVENSRNLAKILTEVFKDELTTTVFIISTDLSHYYDSDTASKMDIELASKIETMQIEKVERLFTEHRAEACGFGGILALLYLAKNLHYSQLKNLKYTHSGEVSGDFKQVVGYLASIVHK